MAKKIYNKFMEKYMQAFGFYMALYGGVVTATGKVLQVELLEQAGIMSELIGDLIIAGSFEYNK